MGEEEPQPGVGPGPRRSRGPDYSGPAFVPREVRDRAVDALPYSARQRRGLWWQMVVVALAVDVVTIWLVVRAVVEEDSAMVGVAIYVAVTAVPMTWGAWRLRRWRRASRAGQGSSAANS